MEGIFNFFYNLMNDPLFAVFLIVGTGLIIGSLNLKGITLGISGVFISGLIFGLFGVVSPKALMNYGLLTFIYVLGIQGGASFFNSLSRKGVPYIIVTLTMVASSILIAFSFGRLMGMGNADILGVYNGSFHNASGLAILLDNKNWGDSLLPSYGMSFPVGAVATVLAVQLIPLIMKRDPVKEHMQSKGRANVREEHIESRKFVVENRGLFGKSLKDLGFRDKVGGTIERIRHNGKVSIPTADTVLFENDVIMVSLPEDMIDKVKDLVGEESFDSLSDPGIKTQRIIMTNYSLHHTELADTKISKSYGVVVTKIERAGILFTPSHEITLEMGDILTVVGKRRDINSVSKYIGKPSVTSPELDLISMSIGCAAGLLLGKLEIPIPFMGSFTLGSSGGVLFVGLFLGYMRRFGIFTNQITDTAKNVIKDIGLSLFMAGVGTTSGIELAGIDMSGMYKMIILAVLTLSGTIASIFAVCHLIIKMNFIKSLACLSGGMFQSAAIATLNKMIGSDEPTAYFATCYPLATFGSIIAAQIMSQILLL